MWKLANTWSKPGNNAGAQRGFPAPGSGSQYTGAGPGHSPDLVPWQPVAPTKGRRTFFRPAAPTALQQGFPSPEGTPQMRPAGSMPNVPTASGYAVQVEGPIRYHRAAGMVMNFGKVLTNPIGAGIVVGSRPQASYGESGQYMNDAIWWSNRIIPTSVGLVGLNDPATMEALLGTLNVQAVVRTTG